MTKNQKFCFKLFSYYSSFPLQDQNGFGKELKRKSMRKSINQFRISCTEVFCKKGVLKNFTKLTKNTRVRPSFLIVSDLISST